MLRISALYEGRGRESGAIFGVIEQFAIPARYQITKASVQRFAEPDAQCLLEARPSRRARTLGLAW